MFKSVLGKGLTLERVFVVSAFQTVGPITLHIFQKQEEHTCTFHNVQDEQSRLYCWKCPDQNVNSFRANTPQKRELYQQVDKLVTSYFKPHHAKLQPSHKFHT